MMVIDTKFNIGEIVYLKTDREQRPCIVSGYKIRKSDVLYYLCSGPAETEHYEFEISYEKNILITTEN